MAVNNPESIRKMKESRDYFSKFLQKTREVSDDNVGIIAQFDTEFGERIRDAGYASSIFMNKIYRDLVELKLGKSQMPSLKRSMHASTICSAYNIGNSKIDKKDIKELKDICGYLARVTEKLGNV